VVKLDPKNKAAKKELATLPKRIEEAAEKVRQRYQHPCHVTIWIMPPGLPKQIPALSPTL
jgi:hypothetical protein